MIDTCSSVRTTCLDKGRAFVPRGPAYGEDWSWERAGTFADWSRRVAEAVRTQLSGRWVRPGRGSGELGEEFGFCLELEIRDQRCGWSPFGDGSKIVKAGQGP